MFPFLIGVASTALDSMVAPLQKRALSVSSLAPNLFTMCGKIVGFILCLLLIITFNYYDVSIFSSPVFLIGFVCLVYATIYNSTLKYKALATCKISDLLLYENIDKAIVIIGGFFLYAGTKQSVSITTFLIAIGTVVLITLFSINIKNISLPKGIGTFLIYKIISGCSVLVISYYIIMYDSLSFALTYVVLELLLLVIIIYFKKLRYKTLLEQSKYFYINRGLVTIFGRTAWMLGLFLMKEVGIVVTALLGFMGIVFNIISMKFLLNDTPAIKQVLLAFTVLLLIFIGIYFK